MDHHHPPQFCIPHHARALRSPTVPAQPTTDDPEVVMGPEGLFPRETYELEIWFHLAATYELLVAAGYPTHRNRGPGVALPSHLAGRGAQTTPEQFQQCVANVRAWVDRWVTIPLIESRLQDVVAFALDEAKHVWFHSWMNNRTHGWPIQYRNWGAMSLCLLMGVERPVLQWVTRLYQHFLRQSNVGFMDGRVAMCMDGFQFAPRLSKGMLACSTIRKHENYRPDDPDALPNVFRIDERLTYDPDLHIHGKLDVERGQPATHILFMANVSPHAHLAAEGDVGLVFSKDSHTVSHESRVAGLAEAIDDPERGTVRINDHAYIRNEVTLEAVRKAMEPAPPGGHVTVTWTGVEINDKLGATVRKFKARRLVNPTTSPLWVGPARRVDLLPGAIVAWPSNLIYGFCPAPLFGSSMHLTKRLNYGASFMAAQRTHSHPQYIAWMHAWGHDVRKQGEQRRVRLPRRAQGTTSEARRHVSKARTTITFVPDSIISIGGAPPGGGGGEGGGGETKREVDVGEEGSPPPAPPVAIADKALTRTVSDVTHHADSAFGYTNCSAFAFAFTYVPEVKTYYSLPMQLSRALMIRFPGQWPAGTTITGLARDLASGGRDWNAGPAQAVDMVRALWDMFAPDAAAR